MLVDEQDGIRRGVLLSGQDRVLEHELVLRGFLLGDVLYHRDEVIMARHVAADTRNRRQHPDELAVFANAARFEQRREGAAGLLEAALKQVQIRFAFRVDDMSDIERLELLLRIAEHLRETPVHAQYLLVEAHLADADRGLVEGRAKTRFTVRKLVDHATLPVEQHHQRSRSRCRA